MFGRIASAAGSVMPSRPSLVRALIAVGVLVAVLLCAMIAAPLILGGDAAKAAIERQLTALTGGDFRYAALDLKMLPRPTAELRQATFRVGSVVEGTADRIALRFEVLPLLKGEVRILTLRLDRPALVVRMPAVDSTPLTDNPVAAYRNAIDPALQWLALHARGLELSVRDGAVELHREGAAPVKLDALSLDGNVASDAIEAKVAAHADFWKRAEAHARIATNSLAANLNVTFEGLEAAPALERALGAQPVRFHPGATDVTLAARTDGQRSITAKLSLAMPSLAITRNGAQLDIGVSRARLNASYAPGDSVVSFEDVTLGVLLTGGAGTLKVRQGAGGTVLQATAARVDAGRVRAAAIAIAEDLPRVRALAAIVKAGIAHDVRVDAAGDDMQALADMSGYDVSMRAEGATIDVPVPSMELVGATGSVRIAKQVLSVGDVTATSGGSRLRNGEMTLVLVPQVALRTLSAAVDLDLAESHPRAAYLLRNTPIAPELGRILSIAGRAKGTLALREDAGRLRGIYDMTSVTGTLRHAGIPLPIAIDGGALRFDTGGALVLRKVAGSIGTSRVEAFDAELAFVPGAAVRSATGTASLNLDELAPWLLALPAASALRGEVSALQGGVEVKLARVAGTLATPLDWQISAVLTPRKVRMASPHLPGRLTIDGGTLRLEDKDIVCDGVGVEMQDARGVVSGPVRAYAAPARSIDISIARATIGARSLKWIEDEAGIAPGVRLQAPLALERARIRWPMPAPWPLEIAAAGSLKSGARAELDLRSRPEGIQIRRLTLKDQDSDVRVVFDWQPERAVMTFHGVLSGRSVGRVLATPFAASGTLRGDFDATIDFREPARSRATGNLEGTDVGLPVAFEVPVTIDRVALDADGARVRVRDASLRVADEPLKVTGTIAHAGDGFDVDADIVAEDIDAERWLARLRSLAAPSGRTPLWRDRLRGRIGVRAGHVDVLGYRLESFAASVTLLDRKLVAEVTEARLCGISVPYTLSLTEGTIDLKGRATAKELPLAAAATCLSKDAIRASGTMDLTADFTASGAPSLLLASSRGTVRLRARDGRVAGARALSGVLEIDEVNQRLPTAEVDSSRDGFSYSTIEIDAKLAGDRLVVERGLLESPILNVAMQGEIRLDDGQVALTGIALPIVNALLRNVPIIGRAVGGPIVGIPISVSGDIKDPRVNRIAATAIAGALVGALQAVVSLPVQLLGAGPSALPAPDPP